MHSLQQLKARLDPLLAEFEEQCAQAEAALRAREWPKLEQSLFEQRRIRQGIVNELAAAEMDVREVPDVFARLQAIFTFRNDQLRRLTAYRAQVSKQLQITRKWKDAARSARYGTGPAPRLISKVL